MLNTLFIRLLQYEDKGAALAERIAGLGEGDSDGDIFAVSTESFRQVPNTPFCYWVSERIRRLFTELPPFEGEGRTVRVGLQTGDDFRFVRAWWEVSADRILDGGRYFVSKDKKSKSSEKIDEWDEEQIREFQDWCRRRSYESKSWVPFAKGGEYSPYYADIHLVVNWEKDGAEIRNFVDLKTGKLKSRPQNTEYYFRPGLTWGDRTSSFLSVKPWPGGGIFSVKGSAGFFRNGSILNICGLMNTKFFNGLLEMLVNAGSAVSRSYQVGVIGIVPFENQITSASSINELTQKAWALKHELDSSVDISHAFKLPILLQFTGSTLYTRNKWWSEQEKVIHIEIECIQAEIDDMVCKLYKFTEENNSADMKWQIVVNNCERKEQDNLLALVSVDEAPTKVSAATMQLSATHFLSWCIGALFGRFDIRFTLDKSLIPRAPDPFDPLPVCPPGMLQNPSGLPAEPGNIVSEEWLRARPDAGTLPPEGSVQNPTIPDEEYSLRISWNGILVDDPGLDGNLLHRDDIVRRTREVLDLLWHDKAQDIENEACEILGVSELREYFRKPSGFFQDHLKRYSKSRRKAPIYWPLSTVSCSYTIWIYYQRLTDQTLYTAVNQYLDPKINDVERGMSRIENELKEKTGSGSSGLKDRLNKHREFLLELKDLREELLRIAGLPYKPNLNDGVIINAAPLHKLFRLRSWAKDTAECWKKLERGDYDWAHLAYTLWPERVKEVCKVDRSIAIAHNCEDLFEG